MMIEQPGERKLFGWISEESMCDIQRGCGGNPLCKDKEDNATDMARLIHITKKKTDLARVLSAYDNKATRRLGVRIPFLVQHHLGFRVV
jgi:hypothetical protein